MLSLKLQVLKQCSYGIISFFRVLVYYGGLFCVCGVRFFLWVCFGFFCVLFFKLNFYSLYFWRTVTEL